MVLFFLNIIGHADAVLFLNLIILLFVITRFSSFIVFCKGKVRKNDVYCIFAAYYCIVLLYVEGEFASTRGNIDSQS